MLDHMFRRRALVYYDNSAGVIHVSGHASQEEQKLLLQLVKPNISFRSRRVSPSLSATPRSRTNSALSPAKFFSSTDGHCIEFKEDGAFRREPVAAGRVLVDSGSLEEIEEVVVRERKASFRRRRRRPSSPSTTHRQSRIAARNRPRAIHQR